MSQWIRSIYCFGKEADMESDIFEGQVKDALSHFYEPAHLQTHPLTDLLVDGSEGRLTGLRLRKLLLDAIAQLQPEEITPYSEPEWFAYRVLQQHYLEGSSREEVCKELGLSRSSYYRYHNEAVSALASILRQQWGRSEGVPLTNTKSTQPELTSGAHEEAMKLARYLPRERVGLHEIVEGVKETVLPLAQRKGACFSIELLTPLTCLYGAPTILRQMVIGVLAEAINSAKAKQIFTTVREHQGQAIWQIQLLGESPDRARALCQTPGILLSENLLKEYGGRIWTEEHQKGAIIAFSIPVVQPKTVLIVDDDIETVRLYREYLLGHGYAVTEARTSLDVYDYLSKVVPDLILLDVLMPGEDGWSIVQHIKTQPEYEGIPIVICSVLTQPELALALGASAVLQKPIGPETLVKTLLELLSC